MSRFRRSARVSSKYSFIALGAFVGAPALAPAQAWVPPAHVGAVSLGLQWIQNTGHLLDDGNPDSHFPGASRDASVYLAIEYGFTDRLSVELGIPFVWAKFVGPGETPPPFLPVDSCYCWHGGFQDFGLIVRYNAIGRAGSAFSLTPSIALGAPSNNYAYQGEAVVGRNLREVALAIDAGERLDFLTPKISVQAHYAYAFVQRVLDIPNNRSNFAFEAEYQLTRRLAILGLAYWQWTHGGLRVPQDITEETAPEHDRLLRNDYFHAGGGLTYALPGLDLYANYIGFVSGSNTHAGWAISVGASWPFELGSGP